METVLMMFMQWVSAAGSVWSYFIVVPVVAGAMFLRGKRRLALATVLVTAGNILNPLIKQLVRRPRPTDGIDGFSFPSGHALGAMIFYGFLIYLLTTRPVRYRSAGIVLCAAFIVLVGISRVYLGAHYVTDVLGGYLIGAAWLYIYICYTKRLTS